MVDHVGRRLKDILLNPLLGLIPSWVHPTGVTLLSLVPGIAAALFAAFGMWLWALFAFALNRILDGLDGLIARGRGLQSDFGGYMDIMIDFVVYAAIPVGVWVGVEAPLPTSGLEEGDLRLVSGGLLSRALPLITLLALFYVNAASWMYLSSLVEKRRAEEPRRSKLDAERTTSIEMPGGLVEGTETVLFYLLFLLVPSYYPLLFFLMAVGTSIGVLQRLHWAWNHLR